MKEWNSFKEENLLLDTKFIKFDNGNVNIVQKLKGKEDSKESFICLSKEMLEVMLNAEPSKDCEINNDDEDICEHSEDGKCRHFLSEGELDCNGTDKEKSKCMCHTELG